MPRKKSKELDNIICECGYQNHKENVKRYGTCRCCGKVLDQKAKFDYEMICRLRLWKNKKRGERL